MEHVAEIKARWDPEGAFVVTSDDIPGLVLSGLTRDEVVKKVQLCASDLIAANNARPATKARIHYNDARLILKIWADIEAYAELIEFLVRYKGRIKMGFMQFDEPAVGDLIDLPPTQRPNLKREMVADDLVMKS